MAMIRRVRTPEGARRFRLPIGSPIVPRPAGGPLVPPVARLVARAGAAPATTFDPEDFERRLAAAVAAEDVAKRGRPGPKSLEVFSELPELADAPPAERQRLLEAVVAPRLGIGMEPRRIATLARAAAIARPLSERPFRGSDIEDSPDFSGVASAVRYGRLTWEMLDDPAVARAIGSLRRYGETARESDDPKMQRLLRGVPFEGLLAASRLEAEGIDPMGILWATSELSPRAAHWEEAPQPVPLLRELARSDGMGGRSRAVVEALRDVLFKFPHAVDDEAGWRRELIERLSDPEIVGPVVERLKEVDERDVPSRAHSVFHLIGNLPTREDVRAWLELADREGWKGSLPMLAQEVIVRRMDPHRADVLGLMRRLDGPRAAWPAEGSFEYPSWRFAAVMAWRSEAVEAVLEAARRDGPTSELVRRAVECGPRLRSTDDLDLIARVPDWEAVPRAIRRDPEALERWLDAPGDWSEEERRWYARAGEVADAYRAARDGGAPHAEAVRQALGIDLEAARARTPSTIGASAADARKALDGLMGRVGVGVKDKDAAAAGLKMTVAAQLADDLGQLASVDAYAVMDEGEEFELLSALVRLGPDDVHWEASRSDLYRFSPHRPVRWRSRTLDGRTVGWRLSGHVAYPVAVDESGLKTERAIPQMTIARAIHQWAATANDESAVALYVQERAEALFGLEGAAPWRTDSETAAKLDQLRSLGAEADVDRVLAAMWRRTQQLLDEHGVTAVRAWRGWGWDDRSLVPDWAQGVGRRSERRRMAHRPLSSYSTQRKVAGWFVRDRAHQALTAATIPAWRILACPLTGFGCLDERELVVLGGEIDGEVVGP